MAAEPTSLRKARADSRVLTFTSMAQYVEELQGRRPVTKMLIANNGISAVKAIRSIRKWAYETFGNERMVQFFVMATPEDLRANAEYIRMAEHVIEVPGGSNNNNYANVMLIVELAERFEVDAVWAGWGHASENPLLPDSLAKTKRKIIFVGPSGKPMRALGDKIGSTIIAQSAHVPTIAWNGDGITVNYKKLNMIPDEIYQSASIRDVDHCVEQCDRIGFPVMIKASEGGGGKGIRKITRREDVVAGYTAVQGEIPGSPIFVMKLAPKSRHLEVQLLADEYGNAIALSGRDCSVQRRHQKIIEEGPVLAPTEAVWDEMMLAATRLAKEVDYVNAGTVEYLFTESPDKDGNNFFFLELNPRLQVEHPVTEMITGVNLPACQLQVAMGIPLHMIPDIRRLYNKDSFGKTKIDFDTEKQNPPHGHVIAARITAEDPNAGFQPTSGAIEELNFRSTADVWGYFSVDSSGRVHEYADSQIGHLFSWSTSRERARKNLALALKELSIRGEINTTVEYLVGLIETDDFKNNRISTSWLDERIARHKELSTHGRPDTLMVVLVGAMCLAYQASNSRLEKYVAQLERGQIPSPELLAQEDSLELIYEGIKYKIKAARSGAITFTLYCNDSYVQADIRTLSDGGYLVLLNGKSHVAYATKEAQGLRLIVDGNTCVFTNEYDPTRLVTNAAGKLARYLVKDGAKLRRGTPYAEVEVMKMYMPLLTPEDGVVRHVKPEGAVLAPGDLIATMELDDPSCVKLSDVYLGKLPAFSNEPENASAKSCFVLKKAMEIVGTLLEGYVAPADLVQKALTDLFKALEDPLLPVEELGEVLSSLAGRIPGAVYDDIFELKTRFRNSDKSVPFDMSKVVTVIENFKSKIASVADVNAFEGKIAPLRDVISKYSAGLKSRREHAIHELIAKYYTVEQVYAQTMNMEDIIMALRNAHTGNLSCVFGIARAHLAVDRRSKCLLDILQHIHQGAKDSNASYVPMLEAIANFRGRNYSLVSLEARRILIDRKMPSYAERLLEMEQLLLTIVKDPKPDHETVPFQKLLDQPQPVFDLLISLLNHKDDRVRDCALNLYIRRIYRTYEISKMDLHQSSNFLVEKFEFKSPVDPAAAVKGSIPKADSYNDLASLLKKGSSSPNLVSLSRSDSTGSDSDSSLTKSVGRSIPSNVNRHGLMAAFENLADFKKHFPSLLEMVPKRNMLSGIKTSDFVHVLHIILLTQEATEEKTLAQLQEVVRGIKDALTNRLVRRITFAVKPRLNVNIDNTSTYHLYPGIYTFRQNMQYEEDAIVRHMEAPLAYRLELQRLGNYNVVTVDSKDKNVHLYLATPKKSALVAAKAGKNDVFQRFFVRAVVRQLERLDDTVSSTFDAHPGPERTLVDALNVLELAMGSNITDPSMPIKNNHVYMNVAPEAVVDPQYLEAVIRILASRYADRLAQLRVSQVELKIGAKFNDNAYSIPVRLVASNPTGYVLRVEAYVEAQEMQNGTEVNIFSSIGDDVVGELDGLPVSTPYPVTYAFDAKREAAKRSSDTIYAYDFLELIEHALARNWRKFASDRAKQRIATKIPNKFLEAKEFILTNGDNEVELVTRPRGQNDVGMVAWLITLYTPELPSGRQLVLISNDITFNAGSFGTREDKLFDLASKYARAAGVPRLYFAANSGARIGMAETIKAKYNVAWKDASDPSKGFEYLYLTKADYDYFNSVKAVQGKELVLPSGEVRYVITDIIGEEKDLGVENLKGSGCIAGESSRAYQDIFTLTYVCGRSVGIGAYLVRLGQRTVQNVSNAPIILTGYQALNKLMGNNVYTSNDQLGGIKIMHNNGVTHLTSSNHIQGIASILNWLSFVPAVRGGSLPIRDIAGVDSIDRPITFTPTRVAYDPRELLTGKIMDSTWHSGFFDKDSFVETLSAWAKTVVVGRGRLGGIPCGVVVTEVRTVEKLTPADPASPTTQESLVQQAGQVWFPDSAHKTATAIRDFNTEDLPLFIFANWRGFSGGQRDMFDEVLKFGAEIVDGLVSYKQPVFVYIPPFAELRGGAWVVVDPTINADCMEMYADPQGRGGVLEPAGLIEIKYRKPALLATAHRVDATLIRLDAQLAALAENDDTRNGIVREIRLREAKLLPIFTQIATHFGDLHDTPGRMKAKEVIRDVVAWSNARVYFYWRLKRRLEEFRVRRSILNSSNEEMSKGFGATEATLQSWFEEQNKGENWSDDRAVLSWLTRDGDWIAKKLEALNQERIAREVTRLGLQDPNAAVVGILHMISELPAANRDEVITALRRGSIFARSTN
ncbi:acetyl-CoA carboxylase [Thraustotheca clavata]|uniref:Acetyl-CoA carboxylase n=1 Tax=Thraustotheca clavata TaxID=74557 RepID=A0A1V9ZPK7_9STRA|nr:acetyl-CoA carboxylase [Thraustotheca clavata]